MTGRARWVVGVLVVALVAASLVLWQRRSSAVDADIVEVREGPFEELLIEEGRTRARWHEDITAPVAGAWTPAGLVAGDSVAAGALLGTLGAASPDPATTSQLRARLGVAQAGLAEARAALATATLREREAQRANERTQRLSTSGGVSAEQLETAAVTHESAVRTLEAARARLAAAEHEVTAARAFLPGGTTRPVEIRAPAAGIILRMDEEHARVVPAGTPLLQLGSAREHEIVARVLSADAPRVRVGAVLYALVGRDTLRGHVLRIEPSAQTVRSALGVEEQRVPVIGDVHSGTLSVGHDYQVDVRIVLRRLERALIVPTGALVRDGGAWQVYVVTPDGVVTVQTVTVLARGADEAAVDGLAARSRVVLYPPEGLTSGGRVR